MTTKKLSWEFVEWPGNPAYGKAWKAKVGRGALWLWPWDAERGIHYVSSFGPNSDKSFSGFLPGATIETAKEIVFSDASKHW